MNVYASNNPTKRCAMWEMVIQTILNNYRWVLAGDVNMVETCHDKTNQCRRLITIRERESFRAMKKYLNKEEEARTIGSLRFLWDNLRLDEV